MPMEKALRGVNRYTRERYKHEQGKDGRRDTSASAETAFLNGADALKAGFEKAVKSYDTVLGYSKDTVEAYMKSATVAGKGIETINSEIYSFSKDAIEDSIAASKAILGSKSLHEAFELQTDYAKSAFEAYVGELTKFSDLFTSTTKETFAPLQGRVQAWVEVVQTARAV
jgi:phasin family protein